MTYDAVVFDMDGVLLSGAHTPRPVYRRATERVLSDYGIEDIPDALFDPGSVAEWREACAECGLPAEEVWTRREAAASELENERIAAADRTPTADADVLFDLTLPIGIVSNNRRATVAFVVDHFDWPAETVRGRVPTLAGYDRRKPDPYYLNRALADLDVTPEDALYVGDRRSDVVAARRAGADPVLFVNDGDPPAADPAYVVESLRDLPV